MKFTIDSDLIAVPARSRNPKVSMFEAMTPVLLALHVAQSIYVDSEGKKNVNQRNYFTTWLRKECLKNEELSKRHFVCRQVDDKGFRIWREF
jgi:hypothetical protein